MGHSYCSLAKNISSISWLFIFCLFIKHANCGRDELSVNVAIGSLRVQRMQRYVACALLSETLLTFKLVCFEFNLAERTFGLTEPDEFFFA